MPQIIEEYEGLEKEALEWLLRYKNFGRSRETIQGLGRQRSQFRKCTHKDIAILMRATKNRANCPGLIYFNGCGIPAYSELGTGYFRAREVGSCHCFR